MTTGPLAGIRVVMMGGLGPAPFCAMLLGDRGICPRYVVREITLTGLDRHVDRACQRRTPLTV